jgi:hypothetical protein
VGREAGGWAWEKEAAQERRGSGRNIWVIIPENCRKFGKARMWTLVNFGAQEFEERIKFTSRL